MKGSDLNGICCCFENAFAYTVEQYYCSTPKRLLRHQKKKKLKIKTLNYDVIERFALKQRRKKT